MRALLFWTLASAILAFSIVWVVASPVSFFIVAAVLYFLRYIGFFQLFRRCFTRKDDEVTWKDELLEIKPVYCYQGIWPSRWSRGLANVFCCERRFNIDPSNGADIDVDEFLKATSLQVNKQAFVSISYKHHVEFEKERDANGLRQMVTSPAYRAEVAANLATMGAEAFWNDGVKAFWDAKDRYRCEGLYAYLLDQSTVLVCLPSPTHGTIDPAEWCPDRFPVARNALLEGMRWNEVEAGNFIVANPAARKPPSLAWGSFNSVWMLAESFCGCLTGRIRLTERSKHAARTFVAEVELAQRLIQAFRKALEDQDCCTCFTKNWVPPYWTINRCAQADQELSFLADEVRDYLWAIFCINIEGVPKPGPFELSRIFVEKIPHANFSQKTDQIMVGALCCYMLQRVAGQGASPAQALKDLADYPDPLKFCVEIASAGQYGFGGGTSEAQRLGAAFRAILRDPGQAWSSRDLVGLSDIWPQPVYGPGFAGSATTSSWKEIFWSALEEGRCLGSEADVEKLAFKSQIVTAYNSAREQRINLARKYLMIGGGCCGMFRKRPGREALEAMEIQNASLKGTTLEVPPDPQMASRRAESLKKLRKMWTTSQSKLRPVIGSDLPILYDSKSGILVVYMLDATELGGYALDALKNLANVWILSGEGEYEDKESDGKGGKEGIQSTTRKKRLTFVHEPGTLKIVMEGGHEIDIPLKRYPLYQMAFAINKETHVQLIIRRRVLAYSEHVEVPIALTDLQRLAFAHIPRGGTHFRNPYSLEDDRLLPVRLYRRRMADFSHTFASNKIFRSKATAEKDKKLTKMLKILRDSPWTDPGPQAPKHEPLENTETETFNAEDDAAGIVMAAGSDEYI